MSLVVALEDSFVLFANKYYISPVASGFTTCVHKMYVPPSFKRFLTHVDHVDMWTRIDLVVFALI